MTRLLYVDIAKGLCILLVVMGHILQFNLKGQNASFIFSFIYSFHMPVFMLLSGYITAYTMSQKKEINYRNIIVGKIKSLVVPFFTWSLLIYPFIFGNHEIFDLFKVSIELMLHPITGAWFLISLFFINIYFLLSYYLIQYLKRNVYSELLAYASVLILISALSICIQHLIPNYGGVKTYLSARYLFMFYLGFVMFKYLQKIIFNDYVSLLSLVFFVLLAKKYIYGISPLYLQMCISIFASISILSLSKGIESFGLKCKLTQMFSNLGKSSLIIYVTHFLVIKMLENTKLDVSEMQCLPLFTILCIVGLFICGISIIFGQLMSHNKLISFVLYGKKWKF